MLISEAFELYSYEQIKNGDSPKTMKNYRAALRSFLIGMGDIPIELVSTQQIALWRVSMLREGNKDSTIATNYFKLRSVLRYCREKLQMPVMHYKDISAPTVEPVERTWLDAQEMRQLIGVIKHVRDRALIHCYAQSGCRLSELLAIDREAYEKAEKDANGTKHIWVIGKGRKSTRICLDKESQRLVGKYLETRTDQLNPLFISAQNNRMHPSTVEKLVAKYAAASGLTKHVTPHVLRHSFASDLFANGAQMQDVRDLMNHRNVNTTLNIYRHTQKYATGKTLAQFQSSLT